MFRVSERFACRVVGQHRSTQRHVGKVDDIEEAKLRRRLREIAAEHIRWGRRMAYRVLRREDWTVNHKWGQRLWREEDLQRPTLRKPNVGMARRRLCAASPAWAFPPSVGVPLGLPHSSWTSSSMPPPMAGGSSS